MPSVPFVRVRPLVIICAAFAVVLSACGGNDSTGAKAAKSTERITVVATAYPLYEVAQSIGGDRVKVHHLLPVSAFDNAPLTSAESQKLAAADLVITPGRGTQPNVAAELAAAKMRTLEVLDGVDVLDPAPGQTGTAHPYAWMDPVQMARIVEMVQARLAAIDPASAPDYQSRAATYRARLALIDRRFAHALAGCKRKDLVTESPEFGYLTRRYGLNQVLTTIEGAPSARVESLDRVIHTYGPTTVFVSKLPSSRAARTLYTNNGVRVAVLDSLANRTDQARRGGANYQSVMKLNLDALRAAFGCTDAFGGK